MIRKCSNPDCKNEFQDKRYGEKQRVMNPTLKNKQSSRKTYRCTVCLQEKEE